MEIKNKKAYFDYTILKEYTAGIELKGTEIKSIRNGSANLNDSFVTFKNNEAYALNIYIAKYEEGNIFNHDPLRTRKLLLHKKEILRIAQKVKEKQYTIIPTKVYLTNGLAKVEIALGKGKKLYDKRESIKKRDLERENKYLY